MGPHVVLPLLQANHAAKHVASVDAHPHADLDPRCLSQFATRRQSLSNECLQVLRLKKGIVSYLGKLMNGPDRRAHVQSHLNAVLGMGGDGVREARYAVVAVTQDLNAKTPVLLQTGEVTGRAGT